MHMLGQRRRWALELVVGHVEHDLRPEAPDDAAFVAKLAGQLGLPSAHRTVHIADMAGNVEANASRARYRALAEIAKEHNATHIVTAHHGRDQLETMLMRLIRGCDLHGLAGMRTMRRLDGCIWLYRPMLACNPDQLRDLLNKLDQPWREDTTNRDVSRLRAQLRHEVLATIEAIDPRVTERAASLGESIDDANRYIRAQAKRVMGRCVTAVGADGAGEASGETARWRIVRQAWRHEPAVIRRAALTILLKRVGLPGNRRTRQVIARLDGLACDTHGGRRTLTLAAGINVTVTRDTATIDRATRPTG